MMVSGIPKPSEAKMPASLDSIGLNAAQLAHVLTYLNMRVLAVRDLVFAALALVVGGIVGVLMTPWGRGAIERQEPSDPEAKLLGALHASLPLVLLAVAIVVLCIQEARARRLNARLLDSELPAQASRNALKLARVECLAALFKGSKFQRLWCEGYRGDIPEGLKDFVLNGDDYRNIFSFLSARVWIARAQGLTIMVTGLALAAATISASWIAGRDHQAPGFTFGGMPPGGSIFMTAAACVFIVACTALKLYGMRLSTLELKAAHLTPSALARVRALSHAEGLAAMRGVSDYKILSARWLGPDWRLLAQRA